MSTDWAEKSLNIQLKIVNQSCFQSVPEKKLGAEYKFAVHAPSRRMPVSIYDFQRYSERVWLKMELNYLQWTTTQTRCCASSTASRFVTESTTSWLWWLTRSTAPVYLYTGVITSSLANQHEHYIHLRLHCSPYHSPGRSSRNVPSDAQLHLSGTHYLNSSSTASLWRPSNLGWKLTFPFIFRL